MVTGTPPLLPRGSMHSIEQHSLFSLRNERNRGSLTIGDNAIEAAHVSRGGSHLWENGVDRETNTRYFWVTKPSISVMGPSLIFTTGSNFSLYDTVYSLPQGIISCVPCYVPHVQDCCLLPVNVNMKTCLADILKMKRIKKISNQCKKEIVY